MKGKKYNNIILTEFCERLTLKGKDSAYAFLKRVDGVHNKGATEQLPTRRAIMVGVKHRIIKRRL